MSTDQICAETFNKCNVCVSIGHIFKVTFDLQTNRKVTFSVKGHQSDVSMDTHTHTHTVLNALFSLSVF